MGIFDGVYFVSDFDGTLLDNIDYKISEENIAAIKYFMSEGGKFGFATGRIISELEDFNDLVSPNAPSITCNGSLLYDFSNGESTLVGEIGEDIIPFLEYVEKAYPNVMIDITTDHTIYHYRTNSSIIKHKSISNADFAEVKHFSLTPHPWLKIAIWDEPEKIRYFSENAERERLDKKYKFMYSYEYCCEISLVSADKGAALLKAKKTLENIKTVVAIGDNENDVTMLKNADISMVPSNAVEDAKQSADIILDCDCNHSAVAKAIYRLKEIILSK